MIPLFEISPELDRATLASTFARDGRVQIGDVLSTRTAREIHKILAAGTPWGISWQAGAEQPRHVRPEALSLMPRQEHEAIGAKVSAAMRGDGYAFLYSAFPMLDAYKGKWDEGGVHDLLLEHFNDAPFLDLIREVAAMPDLIKADAQATLYAPGQFLATHDDSDAVEGRRVAYVLNLTQGEWRPDWGGYLLFYDDRGDVVAGYRPRFNTLNMFAVPQSHSVSYVPPFSPVGRFAITGWARDR